MRKFISVSLLMLLAGITLSQSGCGLIADTDTIVVAELDGKKISRGKLKQIIIAMDDKERPQIRNRGDLLRVLNQYIDKQIKIPLGKELAEEMGAPLVPRELALEEYFRRSGDEEQMLRSIWGMDTLESGQQTELMRIYNLRSENLRAKKDLIELEVDKIQELLQGEAAVAYYAREALQRGELEVDPGQLNREYQLRKDTLRNLEWLRFLGIRYPFNAMDKAAENEALRKAAELRERLDAGADFDTLVNEVLASNEGGVIESEIENNPDLARFKNFWEQASGVEPGTIIGPVYMPPYQQASVDAEGNTSTVMQPDAYMVLKVLERRDERPLTLEEATPQLQAPLLLSTMMERLRDEHGVVIYEDRLDDPARYRDPTADSMLEG